MSKEERMSKEYKSTRDAFVRGMLDLAKEDQKYVMVCADSVKAVRATPFQEQYPDRLFDVGIAEQNAVGFSAGLASCGLVPFVSTYAGFITMRACEQLRTYVAYPNMNVKMVGLNGGIFGGEREGVTHQFFEDLAIVRSIPGITVIAPADASQVYKATKAIAYHDGPVYMRIGSGREYQVFEEHEDFEIGKARVLIRHGNDLAIFTNGFVLNRVLKAAEILKNEGIYVTVVEVHTLKPLDTGCIVDILQETNGAVTVEDHNVIGGLGSAISEVASEHIPVPLIRLGLQDIYPKSGEADELLDQYGMSLSDIRQAVYNVRSKKEKLRNK